MSLNVLLLHAVIIVDQKFVLYAQYANEAAAIDQ